ncbi:Putative Ethanolamine kinase [Penicillium brasilianum]|uniref:ethanolamine kinase n=1 Tax=Penicillium brasilianum TaxID=104259 RepID=A0A0F7TQ59_PENBI|nr:Putative Ethanolamine kinase [Penicillium brasilianum]
MGSCDTTNGAPALRYIPLTYTPADSQASALRLILTLFPHWEGPGNKIEFVRFTDGITNTLLKIINRKAGLTDEEIDNDAVLMRAYGNGTEILIDRERETTSHALLASRGLAPPLLARFNNGLLYRFIRGKPCGHEDLVTPPIFRGVARKLAQWHAVLPNTGAGSAPTNGVEKHDTDLTPIQTRRAGPSMWAVLQRWVLALPVATPEQQARRLTLQKELEWVVGQLDDGVGIGEDGLVFAHCDLLCANVIVLPDDAGVQTEDGIAPVNFIDYEYAVPAQAAFDIANHLAEWIGYDCDYNMIPTRSVRRQFLTEYTKSYCENRGLDASSQAEIVDRLYQDVDRFRGIPGLYWGVWALIQAQISQIDFDYADYAEQRLGEYWAWKREVDGSRKQAGEEMPLREKRWAQEA